MSSERASRVTDNIRFSTNKSNKLDLEKYLYFHIKTLHSSAARFLISG